MKSSFRILFVGLAWSLCFGVQAYPPEQGGKHGRGGMWHDQGMLEALDLTDEQKQQIDAIRAERMAQREAILKKYNLTIDQWHALKQELMEQRRAQKGGVHDVLTDEQRAKMRELMKQKMGAHSKGQKPE